MITDLDVNIAYFSKRLCESQRYKAFANQLVELLGDKMRWIEDSYCEFIPENKKPVFHTLDIWCRDYMPIQVSEYRYIHYHYFPTYLLNTAKYRASITNPIRVEQELGIDCESLNLILDGGNVIKTDHSVILTKKVFDDNKLSHDVIISRLQKALGVPIVFIDWDKQNYKADYLGHADGVVRYVGNNTVIMPFMGNDEYLKTVYRQLTEEGNFKVVELPKVSSEKKDLEVNWGYVNYLRLGNFILRPTFGIETDEMVMSKFFSPENEIFAGCEIKTINCRDLALDGGVLNCISWTIRK